MRKNNTLWKTVLFYTGKHNNNTLLIALFISIGFLAKGQQRVMFFVETKTLQRKYKGLAIHQQKQYTYTRHLQ